MMLTKARRILKIGVLLGLVLFVCMQILNVRSPITIEQAMATSNTRVEGTVYKWGGVLSGATARLTKPDGSVVYGSTNAAGYFAFSGDPTTLPNGTYSLRVSKSGYDSVSRSFTLGEGIGATATVYMVQYGSSWMYLSGFAPWY